MENIKFKTNAFYIEAMKYIESTTVIEDKEIAKNDLTDLFYAELYNILKNRESINININANVRKGKSTILLALGVVITDMMRDLNITKKQFGIWNIARTQYELSKKMRDPKLNNVFIAIDEYDDMEDTGENSTVEQALLKHFSKIQAGRYIHRGYCSPSNIPDEESNIILNVIQPDKERKVTHCRLYYKVLKGNLTYIQLIGHVNIDVGFVVKNWIENGIEEIFYKQRKNEEYRKTIEKWRQQDFYVEYMCRKFEKMDMMNEKGIFRTKELDYADVIIMIIEDLYDLSRIGGLSSKEIKNHVRAICRKYHIPQSLIGEQLMTDRVDGYLSLVTRYFDNGKRINKLRASLVGGHGNPKMLNEEINLLEIGRKKLKEVTDEEMEELKYLRKIKELYYGEDEVIISKKKEEKIK